MSSSPPHRPFERSVSVASDSSADWDTSMTSDDVPSTPRNSVAFPRDGLASQSENGSARTPSHSRGPSHSGGGSSHSRGPSTPSRQRILNGSNGSNPSNGSNGSIGNANANSIGRNAGARTLSDILRKHADNEFAMDQEEATRVGDVLRGWINSSNSPYEAEDEEFSTFVRSKDDPTRGKDDMHVPSATRTRGSWGRARGMSESVGVLGRD